MRQTKFQLDDWVFVNGLPMQVKAIHKNKLGFHTRVDRLDWYRINPIITPIPLTDEILEKNFQKMEYGFQIGTCWKIWENQNYGYILVTLTIDEFCGGSYEPCIPCTYLHELQHLMTDLRIDKKIEL